MISGFKKGEKTFDAILSWSDSEKKISFTFPTEQNVKQT
ncbi:hypothetical protein RCO48_33360 [Peribacillus frigoritolerans]|nr:hypothetical protein [Peribacillus frigoritolerans]